MLILSYIIDTGFCSRESIRENDVTFDWPETVGGGNASFLCPNNATVTRWCGVGGKWQDFDHESCITGQSFDSRYNTLYYAYWSGALQTTAEWQGLKDITVYLRSCVSLKSMFAMAFLTVFKPHLSMMR